MYRKRYTRAIVALAVVAVCVIAARWYVLERLQGAKERALEAAEQALDCDIRVGKIRSEAIDTFVIEDVDVRARDEGDNGRVASIPLVRVSIDLPHLIRGGVRAREIELVSPEVLLDNNEPGRTAAVQGILAGTGSRDAQPAVTVKDGRLAVKLGDSEPLRFSGIGIQAARAPGFDGVQVQGECADVPFSKGPVAFKGTVAEAGNWNIKLTTGEMILSDLARLAAPGREHGLKGTLAADVELGSLPDQSVSVRGNVSFTDLAYRDVAEPFTPISGNAGIDLELGNGFRSIVVGKCNVQSEDVSGNISGNIEFSDGGSVLGLLVKITDPEIEERLEQAATQAIPQFSEFDVEMSQDATYVLKLTGDASNPETTVSLEVRDAAVRFSSVGDASGWASGNVRCKDLWVELGEDASAFAVRANIVAGDVATQDLALRELHGDVAFSDNIITLEGVSCALDRARLNLDGTVSMTPDSLSQIDFELDADTVPHLLSWVIPNGCYVDGTVIVTGTVVGTVDEQKWTANADFANARVRCASILEKPALMPATMGFTFVLDDTLRREVAMEIDFDGSSVKGDMVLTKHEDGVWRGITMQAQSSAMEIPTLAALFNLPVKQSSDRPADWAVSFSRDEAGLDWKSELDAHDVTILAGEKEGGIGLQSLALQLEYDRQLNRFALGMAGRTAVVDALRLELPGFLSSNGGSNSSATWDLDLRLTDCAYKSWRLDEASAKGKIEGGALNLAPVACEAYGGTLNGEFKLDLSTEDYASRLTWQNLEMSRIAGNVSLPPTAVHGRLSGEIELAGTLGQPNKRRGEGHLELAGGQIDSSYFIGKVQNNGESEAYAPVTFEKASARLRLQGGVTYTEEIEVQKTGLRFSGEGWFDSLGNLNYDFKTVLSPELVEQIPMLKKRQVIPLPAFARDDLPLDFKLTGNISKLESSVEARPIQIELATKTVKLGTDAVDVGIKAVEMPTRLFLNLLQYGASLPNALTN